MASIFITAPLQRLDQRTGGKLAEELNGAALTGKVVGRGIDHGRMADVRLVVITHYGIAFLR